MSSKNDVGQSQKAAQVSAPSETVLPGSLQTNEMNTLGDALPREMARVRDELIPAYQSIGPAGVFGLAMLRASLDTATKALASGDVVQMLRSYQELKDSQ